MSTIKPLANRKNAVTPNSGSGQNSPIRFRDSTASVAGQMFGGMTNKSGQQPRNGSGCSGCNE